MSVRSPCKFENYVRYDRATGHFYWLKTEGKRIAGERADHLNPQGYWRIFTSGPNGETVGRGCGEGE